MKRNISLLVFLVCIFAVGDLSTAGDTTTSILMVECPGNQKPSVKVTLGTVGVNNFVTDQGLKVTKDKSIPCAITIQGTNTIKITGKITSNMPPSTALYVGPVTLTGAAIPHNVTLSSTEQDITGITKRVADGTSTTYSFTYSIVTADDAVEKDQKTIPPVIVTVTGAF